MQNINTWGAKDTVIALIVVLIWGRTLYFGGNTDGIYVSIP